MERCSRTTSVTEIRGRLARPPYLLLAPEVTERSGEHGPHVTVRSTRVGSLEGGA